MLRRLWEQLAIATNWPVLVAVLVLSSVGVVSIYFSTHAASTAEKTDGAKQLIFLGVSLGCMLLFQVANYQKIGEWAWPFYVFSLLLILYTVVAQKLHGLPFVHETKGAWAWIDFGRFSLEPAELMKIAFVLVLAKYLRFRSNYRTMAGLLAPFAVAAPVPVAARSSNSRIWGWHACSCRRCLPMLFVAGAWISICC